MEQVSFEVLFENGSDAIVTTDEKSEAVSEFAPGTGNEAKNV